MSDVNLYGRIFIEAEIKAVTGLHIGGAGAGLEIGGLDKEVIRNPITKRPYIPGSSLRGKMRSQTEKVKGMRQNNRIGQVTIHTCKKDEYKANGGCPVCHVFGVPADIDYSGPTRLVVRDAELSNDSAKRMENAKTDLLYAELKTEVAIDRVTSAASPRTIERVPAEAVFGPVEMVFSIYEPADYERLKVVVDALQLVEDDYLGGAGSRGSGKVKFQNIRVYGRQRQDYGTVLEFKNFDSIQALSAAFGELKQWMSAKIPAKAGG